MSRCIISLALFLVSLSCLGETTVEQGSRGYHGSGKTYGKAKYYVIKNEVASYMVYLQWVNATATEAPQVLVGVPEPWFFSGFLSRGFTSLKVNDISSTYLEPKSIAVFREEGKAGIELLYNFNGCRLLQRFYMKDGKPVLFTEWRRASGSQTAMESAVISFGARPSLVLSQHDYLRAIQTKSRLMDTPAKGTVWANLKAEDRYWIAYDKELEPSKYKDAEGPCYLTADWSGVKTARVWYGHVYSMLFQFTLDCTKDKWTFATAEFKKASDNAAFMERVKREEGSFAIE